MNQTTDTTPAPIHMANAQTLERALGTHTLAANENTADQNAYAALSSVMARIPPQG